MFGPVQIPTATKMYSYTLLGETSRNGFYVYDDKRRASIDPEVAKYVEKSRKLSGFAPDSMVSFNVIQILSFYPCCPIVCIMFKNL